MVVVERYAQSLVRSKKVQENILLLTGRFSGDEVEAGTTCWQNVKTSALNAYCYRNRL